MGKLSNAKLFGGLGAILSLIGGFIGAFIPFIPFAGLILQVIGLVLVFVAVKYISEETKYEGIFNNYLISFILTIIATVALVAGLMITFGSIVLQSEMEEKLSDVDEVLSFVGGIIVSIIIFWIVFIFSARYLRKSYNHIAKHTGVDLFRTTGTFYFFGAITLIVVIGVFILLLAGILQIIAYFSLPDTLPVPEPPPKTRHCPDCGRSIPMDANVCPYCGKKCGVA